MKNKSLPRTGADAAANRGAKKSPGLQPYRILQDAIQAVPAVKYALGVAGIVAAVAIVTSFGIDLRIAGFGAVITFVLMVALVVFAKISKTPSGDLVVPARVMMWSFLVLLIATAVLLFSSVFFRWPIDLQEWLKPFGKVVISEKVAALPAGEVLKIAYTSAPPPPVTQFTKPGLEFGISARRKGEAKFSLVKDGDSLASEVDDYCVIARAQTDGYLYVFQVDSSGKAEWLFPRNTRSKVSTGSNPLVARQTVQIPSAESGELLYLDTHVGLEHIYAVFSASRWPELEEQLSRPAPISAPSQVAKIESPNGLGLRGVGGKHAATITPDLQGTSIVERTQEGKVFTLPFSNGSIQASGSFVVEERWFKHVAP